MLSDGKLTEKLVRSAVVFCVAAAVLWLGVKFFLPVLLPFIFAFLTAWFLEGAVSFLCEKFRMKRGFSAAVCALFIFFVLFGVAALAVSRLIYEAAGFVQELPHMLSWVPDALGKAEQSLEHYVRDAPEGVAEYISRAAAEISEKAAELPAVLSEKALAAVSSAAAAAPAVLLACVTYIIGVFFITRGYVDIKHFLLRQIPENAQTTARNLKNDLADGFLLWLRAQFLLIALTFAQLLTALTLMKIRYAALISLITAVVDAFPILGTGTVLIPWAVVLFMGGDTQTAAGLVITYGIVTVVRSFAEPKLVGDRFGIHPAAALLAIYSGFKLAGFGGMILFPIALIMLKQINDKGYVKLWK